MGIKHALNSRVVAVGVGASALALLAGGAGFAAGQINSGDIKDNTIRSQDVRDGGLKLKDLSDWTERNLSRDSDSFADTTGNALADPKTIEKIGGPINDNNTDLDVGITLEPGRYVVTVDGSFISDQAAGEGTPAVWPQLSLWIDRNDDGNFQWQALEGDISPNALMPTAAKRHISVHGSTVIDVDEITNVGLLGFGYAADGSDARSGEIKVNRAVLTATPLP
jgi:hypothetical protein